jgi:hypothetical protein
MNTKIKISLLLIVIAIAATATITMIHSQSSRDSKPQKKQDINIGEMPIADYTSSVSSDLQERTTRVKRSKRYNMDFKHTGGVGDAKRFMLTENRESSYGGFPTHAPEEPAIPAASSDAVVIGEVTNAKAYLSEDKTAIYSEFNVAVSAVLKNKIIESLSPGTDITVSRGGGAVRFSSGKIIRNLFGGKPLPGINRKYIFFLKYNEEGQDYPIITAYQLNDGKITPLDGINIDGSLVNELASHQSYKGESETAFLNQVQAAIGASKDVFEQGVFEKRIMP